MIKQIVTSGLVWCLTAGIFAPAQTPASAVDVTMTVRYVADSAPAGARQTAAQEVNRRTVIWLVPLDSTAPLSPSPTTYTMTQKGKEFHPRLLVIPVGSTVSFPNADPFFHNVFSLFNGRRFDLGLYQSGQTRNVEFNREGVSYIFCNIHPEMSAVIISLKTPYFASTNVSGLATLHGVPEGTYTLAVWSELASPEMLRSLVRTVVISRNNSNLGEIDIRALSSGLENHLNKFGLPYDTHSAPSPY